MTAGYLAIALRGEASDLREGEKWLTLAANQGNAEAMYTLGRLTVKNKLFWLSQQEAAQWFDKAARQGLLEAKQALDSLCGQSPTACSELSRQ